MFNKNRVMIYLATGLLFLVVLSAYSCWNTNNLVEICESNEILIERQSAVIEKLTRMNEEYRRRLGGEPANVPVKKEVTGGMFCESNGGYK